MAETYRTIAAPVDAEVEAKRSRFLARLEPAATEDAAREVVERARKQHWDARHHCSAFVLGPDAMTERSSDDGEPAGTAGAPMLEVLRGRELTDVVCVVTRWFGGTLLGTGGLIRAYGDAVRAACESARVVERRLLQRCTLAVGHAEAGRVESTLRARGVHVDGVDYAAAATLRLDVAPGERAALAQLVAELTSGAGVLVDGPVHWV
ncbi:YigZ family protein [Arsenicicoccus dermatophilus]|uniref:YigZ family protein n=1 Tax=Arsenicicoccus dermatophilus TaxID=1076331 RepID=UPI001F4CA05B|nr:YigZ family protein [Arsenicicoccus dermatophilus]MCH8613813.1 YigZ family protein [Arsenicicoccus dermatophilus]